jgi:hypothetical protein
LVLEGDAVMTVDKGTAFTDPGYTASENGEAVDVTISGSVNTAEAGLYTLTYAAVNSDGFRKSVERQVYVVDRTSFASIYFGESQFGARHYYDAPVLITDNGDGTYDIDDIVGGFYNYGRYPGYPQDFALEATLKLESDNTVTLTSIGTWYWEDENLISITTGTYDPVTGKIVLNVDWGSNGIFYVTLTK